MIQGGSTVTVLLKIASLVEMKLFVLHDIKKYYDDYNLNTSTVVYYFSTR